MQLVTAYVLSWGTNVEHLTIIWFRLCKKSVENKQKPTQLMGITSTAMARNHFGQWQQKAHNIIFIHQQRTAIYQHYIVLRNTNNGQRTPQTKKHKRTNEWMNRKKDITKCLKYQKISQLENKSQWRMKIVMTAHQTELGKMKKTTNLDILVVGAAKTHWPTDRLTNWRTASKSSTRKYKWKMPRKTL